MIVADASAVVLGLLNNGEARAILRDEPVVTPHLADPEVVSAMRSQVFRGEVSPEQAEMALDVWRRLGVRRVGVEGVLGRIWELRDNLSAYDATYVAVAEVMDCALVTADARMAGAPGVRCPLVIVRR